MNRLLYIALYSSLLLAFTACTSDDAVQENNDTDKSPIELTVGIADGAFNSRSASRAITVDPDNKEQRGILPENTALFMVMKSEKTDASDMWSVTKGVTRAADDNKFHAISFSESGCTRYWDDCYARDAQLSVFAACAPGSTETITIGGTSNYPYTSTPTTGAWKSDVNSLNITDWSVATTQTETTLKQNDLCYSNNISKYEINSESTDKRLKFGTLTPKKFDTGNLCFYHALSWITFEIIKGDGFTDSEFTFPADKNITLKKFYTKNTKFDLVTGDFTGTYSSQDIVNLAQRTTKTEGSAYTLDAIVMPTTDMSATTVGEISLTIAGNKYDISKKALLDNISPDDKTNHMIESNKLKPGVHYIFKLTIGKTKVNSISATILPWEEVTAVHEPTNARISLKLEERDGTAVTEGVNIYRTKDTGNTAIKDDYEGYVWSSGYTKYDSPSYSSGVWTTPNWYWEDNTTYYHFRAVKPATQTITTVGNVDYTSLKAGESYTDVVWGAPFLDNEQDEAAGSFKLYYNTTNGFDATGDGSPNADHQIYKAIGPTKDQIKLLMFHMMSDVTFEVKTTKGTDAVDLGNGSSTKTTITLKNIYTSGKVQMGDGKVITDGSTSNYLFTETPTKTNATTEQSDIYTWANYGAIPQSLENVVLVITTPDNNQYEVDMKEIVASRVSNTNVTYPAYPSNKVNYWYPGVKYTYTFTLKKKGISDITATILEWEEVEAGNNEVTIK